jgi:hypothetical protein
MAVTHVTALKVTIGTAVQGSLNAGSGALQAVEFQKADTTVIASVALATTPWGAPNGSGVITAAGLPANATVSATATCTLGRIKDKDGTVKINFATGTSGSDVNFDAVAWTLNGTVTLSSLTYVAA